MSHSDFHTTVLLRSAQTPEALKPWPEVVRVGPRIGDRADTPSGVRQ